MASFRSLAALAALSLVQNVHSWNIDLPICTEPFQPFVYSGCYQDLKSPNALVFKSDLDTQSMTVELCVAECKGNGYRYAGLEYYGECYCGTSVNGPQVDESECSFPCTGNSSETCGGNSLMNVWQDTTFPTGEATVADYVSLGCYTDDSGSGRTLSFPMDNVDSATMTTETCLDACKDAGFPYAGTEYGGECWCGVVVGNFSTSAPSEDCSIACNGDSSELCGGRSRLNLYVAKDLESLQPCGYVPSSSSSSVLPPTSSTKSVSSTSSVPTSSKPATSSKPVTSSTKSSSSVKTSSTTTSCKETTTTKPKTSSTSTKKTSTTTSCKETTTTKPKTTTTSTKKTSTTTSPCKETTTSKAKTTSTSTKKTSTTTSSCKETTTTKPRTTSTSTKKTSTTTPCTTSKGQPPQTTSSTKAPSTTSKPVTTKPPVSSTSSAALCTTTVTIPSTCEYGCGKWCSDEIPDFDDVDSCKSGSSHCKLQVAACFKNAGWPGAMDCFDFSSWCSDIGSYCTSAPSRGGKCSKGDAWKSKPPKGGSPATTSTSVYTCKPTSTSTSSTKKTTSTSTSTTKCPVPTATGICKQPTNKQYGYAPGSPVGDIDLPILTCNDLKDDFSKYPFKLYTDSDSKKCGGYSRPSVPNACADACKAQYDQCQDTYATGCKEKNGNGGSSGSSSWWPWRKRSAFPGSYFDYLKAPNKRTFGWTDTYTTASSKCTAQYNDCLSQNKGVSAGTKCSSYGTGW